MKTIHFKLKYLKNTIYQVLPILIMLPMIHTRTHTPQSPHALLTGLFIGTIGFALSYYVTTPSPKLAPPNIFKWSANDIKFIGKQILIHAVTALTEELLWRAGIQGVLIKTLPLHIATLTSSILFWALHQHQFNQNRARMIEFMIFTLSLSYLFEFTNAITLVIGIHFMRNILIIIYRIRDLKKITIKEQT